MITSTINWCNRFDRIFDPQEMIAGDLLVLASAFSYTFHVVRLGKYAKTTKPLTLALVKQTAQVKTKISESFDKK